MDDVVLGLVDIMWDSGDDDTTSEADEYAEESLLCSSDMVDGSDTDADADGAWEPAVADVLGVVGSDTRSVDLSTVARSPTPSGLGDAVPSRLCAVDSGLLEAMSTANESVSVRDHCVEKGVARWVSDTDVGTVDTVGVV